MLRRGFTLIELLIFVAIFSLTMAAFITIFISIVGTQSQQSYANEVQTQGQFLMQQIQYYVQSARLIDMAQDSATTTLKLREAAASSSIDPVIFTLATGTIYLQRGSGTLQALTSNKVSVSNLSFTHHYNLNSSSSAYGTDSISFSFAISSAGIAITSPQYYSQTFQSSAAVTAPVPKISLIQQAVGTNNNASVSTVNASYAISNATSDLLIAVVSNTGTSTATTSVSDTASNTWTLIASTSYPAYNQKTVIYDAPNAKSSSNTVTASFGNSVNYPILAIYEYRGAATSSSFDASSTQTQSNTASPSSGSASPTSSVELLFVAMYSNPSTEIPAAGSGFALETTSTLSTNALYVEDAGQYITGPVSGGFSYSATAPSSSVTLITFK